MDQELNLNENTPLLSNVVSHERPYIYKRVRISLYILAIIAVLAFFAYYILNGIGSAAVGAVHTTIYSFSVLGLSDNGVECRTQGSINIDYSHVQSIFQEYFLQLSAFIVGGSIVIKPTTPITLFLRPKDQLEFAKFAQVMSPSIKAKILQNSTTEFDVTSTSQIDVTNVAWLSKYLLQKEASFDVHAKFKADFTTTFFTIKDHQVDVITSASWERKDPSFAIDSLDFKLLDQSIAYEAGVSIDTTDIPFDFTINSLLTSISLKDCKNNYVDITQAKTSEQINLVPYSKLFFNISGLINSIPKSLSQVCSTTIIEDLQSRISKFDISPINNLLLNALKGKNIELFINISYIKGFPIWVINILKSIHIPLSVKTTSLNDFIEKPFISNFSMINLDVDTFNEQIFLHSNISVNVNSLDGSGFDLNFPSFGGRFEIWKDNQKLISGETLTPGYCQGTPVMNISSSLKAKVEDGEKLGQAISQLLRNISSEYTVKVYNSYLQLNSPIYSGKLDELSFERNIEIESLGLEKFINKCLLSIGNLRVVGSTATSLSIETEVNLIQKSFEFFIDFPIDYLRYQVSFDEKVIGEFSIKNIKDISNNFYFNMVLTLFRDENNALEVQNFLSRYISGYPDLKIDITNGNVSVHNNVMASQLLSNLKLTNFTIPKVEFGSNSNNEIQMESSPFIVSATIYLLRSEVELTIFNPISNRVINGILTQAIASFEGQELGHMGSMQMKIPPGIFVSPRIPFTTNKGLGGDILRRALNNQLDIEVLALFDISLEKDETFGTLNLMYKGSGLKSNIKL